MAQASTPASTAAAITPQASNKEAFEEPVSGSGTFNSGKNGQITASLTVSPPPSTLDCPGGQRLVLACVAYTNITLTDETTPVTADIAGTVSETLLTNPLLPECAGFWQSESSMVGDPIRRGSTTIAFIGGSPSVNRSVSLCRRA
jgi:hypothetical protein